MSQSRISNLAFTLTLGASLTSGALTMALETILLKLATRYTGCASESTVMTLSLFLSGLLAGTYAVTKLNQRHSRLLDFMPALAPTALSLALFFLAYLTSTDWQPADIFTEAAIFLLAMIAGSIFPTLIALKAKISQADSQSNDSNMLLYLVSCAGGAIGVLGCFLWLLPNLGIKASLTSLILPAALTALLSIPLIRAAKNHVPENPENDWQEAVMSMTGPLICLVVAAASFAGIYLECLQIKLLNLIMGASYVTTCGVLTATMIAVAIGTRLALCVPRSKTVRPYLICAIALSALCLGLTIFLIPDLNSIFQALRALSAQTEMSDFMRYFYPRMLLAFIFCLPATTALAMVFPLAARGVSRAEDTLKLYMASAAGTLIAPLIFYGAGGWTLPAVPSSIDCQLRLLAIFTISITFALAGRRGLNPLSKSAGPLVVPMLTLFCLLSASAALLLIRPTALDKIDLGLSFVPSKLPLKAVSIDASRLRRLFYHEGRAATVTVLQDPACNTTMLRTDGKIEGTVATDMAKPAKNSDISTQTLLAILPLICQHNDIEEIKNCFIIGFGTGTTYSTMRQAAAKADVQAVDIEPAVFAAGQYFKNTKKWLPNGEARDNSQCTTGDARQILERLDKSFDVIISQPSEPWVQGSTNLYSAEFYRIVRQHLGPDGNYCQWLPLYGLDADSFSSAVSSFDKIFPGSLVAHRPGAGEVLLLGSKCTGSLKISKERLQANLEKPKLKALMATIGLNNFRDFEESIGKYSGAKSQDIVTDDNLRLEFSAVKNIEDAEKTIAKNLAKISTGQSID